VGRRELKLEVTIKTGTKIVLLNHLIKMFHQVAITEFSELLESYHPKQSQRQQENTVKGGSQGL
jgi:hypothetical protein